LEFKAKHVTVIFDRLYNPGKSGYFEENYTASLCGLITTFSSSNRIISRLASHLKQESTKILVGNNFICLSTPGPQKATDLL